MPISSHLDRTSLVNKGFIKRTLFLRPLPYFRPDPKALHYFRSDSTQDLLWFELTIRRTEISCLGLKGPKWSFHLFYPSLQKLYCEILPNQQELSHVQSADT